MIRNTRPGKLISYYLGFVLLLLAGVDVNAWYSPVAPIYPYPGNYVPRYPLRQPPVRYPPYYQQRLQQQRQLIDSLNNARQAELKRQKQRYQHILKLQRKQQEMLLQQQKKAQSINKQFIRQFRLQQQEWLELQKKGTLEQNKSRQKYFRQFFDDQRA